MVMMYFFFCCEDDAFRLALDSLQFSLNTTKMTLLINLEYTGRISVVMDMGIPLVNGTC